MTYLDQSSLAYSRHPGSRTIFYARNPVELSLMAMRRWVSILLLTVLIEMEVIATNPFDEGLDIHPNLCLFLTIHMQTQRMMSISVPDPSRLKESFEHQKKHFRSSNSQRFPLKTSKDVSIKVTKIVSRLKTKKNNLKIKDPRSQGKQRNYEGMPTATRFQDLRHQR
ncbi:hypothetical protein Tco_0694212 [Tanacetum coccineum]